MSVLGGSLVVLSLIGIGLVGLLLREMRRRRQAEAAARETHDALRKSEDFLERTGRLAGIGGWERDLLTDKASWSAETCRLLGTPPGYKPHPGELVDFFAPDARQAAAAALAQATSNGEGWDLELPLLRSDGHETWARWIGVAEFAAGKPIRLAGSLQDVTSQRAARLELKEALERVTSAADAGQIGIWDWDVSANQIIWNPRMYTLYGLDPRDGPASYDIWLRRLHPDDRASAVRAVGECAEGVAPLTTEFRIIWDDGTVRHIQAAGKMTRDPTGHTVRLIGTNWDVTEARELAAELARRAELLTEAAEREAALFLNSQDYMFIIRVEDEASGPAFIYEGFNPAHSAVTGIPSEDLIGRRPEACLPPNISELLLSRYNRCLQEGKTITYSNTYDLPVGTRDFEGSITPVRSSATGKISRLVGMMRDVTERNQMEDALRHAQKLEAIGRLSAGVAHDFNNILQIIVGGLEMVLDEVNEGTPAYEFANVAINSATRGASLTHRLLSYARKQILRPQPVEVAPLLAELEILLTRTLGAQTTIRVRVNSAGAVMADPGQLQTALLNLAINSSHSMPQGGILDFTVRAEHEASNSWIVIAVTDTGCGMDEATMAQATEPFFTTKGVEGSGLGLSMVQGFAEQSGGRFQITSLVGEGTTVELRLPSVAYADPNERPALGEIPPAKYRILLVDDAPAVLATTAALLEKCGFAVVQAGAGDTVLALLGKNERFDALVTDYAMPGLNGVDLIAKARITQPGLKALLITGYAAEKHAETLPTDVPVLQKPFKRSDLIEALHRVLQVDRDTAPEVTARSEIQYP